MVLGCGAAGTTTVLATRGAICKYCEAYSRSDGSDDGSARDSDGRASGASMSPDCGLSAEFVDCASNADTSDALGTSGSSDVGDAHTKRASGEGASYCDCLAAPSGTGDAMRAEIASWCAVARGS